VDNILSLIVILFALNVSLSITRLAAKIIAALLARINYLGLLGLISLFLFQYALFSYWNLLINWIRLGVSFAYQGTVPFNLWKETIGVPNERTSRLGVSSNIHASSLCIH
jgi:hypothetical protein